MPIVITTILTTLAGVLGRTLLNMLMSLLTEKVIKHAIIAGLDKLVARTQSEVDDKLLIVCKEAWGMLPASDVSAETKSEEGGEGNAK